MNNVTPVGPDAMFSKGYTSYVVPRFENQALGPTVASLLSVECFSDVVFIIAYMVIIIIYFLAYRGTLGPPSRANLQGSKPEIETSLTSS